MKQSMCLNPGDILRDRYQIIGKLGEGGFAKTYREHVTFVLSNYTQATFR